MTASAAEPGEPLMTAPGLIAYLGGGITEVTLQHWRTRGGGPPFIKVGHFVRYRLADVNAWLDERERGQVPA
jgi:hypothetical protein